MKMAPDDVTLDAMVSGLDEEGDLDAWNWLLTSTSAAETWGRAVERRLRIERYAQALIAHPWIAQLQSALRTLAPSSRAAIEAVVEPELLLADLGQTAAAPMRLAGSAWGRIETALVPVGTTVGLRWEEEHEGMLRFFYKTAVAEGELAEALWVLEAGEAPVLLLACAGAEDARTLVEALASAERVAGVLLLEETLLEEEA
ncbi:hypothetical protein ATI61_10650 [Archangium gephyra]|uniref:Uncharacterized protein n=1 Tax=Archangium gephyra TaxID=48 RepID=A0AAC8TBQ4_9BACT|nr:hypothetical protein [Archangium gephyra]AKI98650.1 Hypothetical protein AA314_00277 [Archangium gephyra]REG30581.1 hypothetical protein ATI61_10650 [Archangium gephyra]